MAKKKITSKSTLKKKTSKKAVPKKEKKLRKPKGLRSIISRILVLCLIVFAIVKYFDSSGLFEPDQRNNHTQKKWDSLYDFTEKQDLDVVLVGNSHMYNGMNPKTLSAATNANNFVLASPGTRISDTYYCLKEAFAVSKPKVAIVETYGIKGFDQHNLGAVALSDQLKSFAARKNIWQKLISMPDLFNINNYLIAWSNTIRNHSFLLSDRAQIETNRELLKQKNKEEDKLYLGRFIAYQTGIQKEVLDQYKSDGPPVDGANYKYAKVADDYVQDIAKLCKDSGVELLFLTLPMYEEHIANYPVWKKELARIIDKTGAPWLDLQEGNNYEGFTTTSFQNTYKNNQHLTYLGSILATYKVKDYLMKNYSDILPDRSKENNWVDLFYGEEGYFDSHPVRKADKINKILATNIQVNNVVIERIEDIKLEKARKIIAKIDKVKYKYDWSKYKLRVLLNYTQDGQSKKSYLDLDHNKHQNSNTHFLFAKAVQNIEMKSIENIQIINI